MKVLLLLVLFSVNTNAQSIWSNPITGTNPSTSNPYLLGQTTDPNIIVSGIGRGPGINPSSANDRYSASNWNSASLNPDDYFHFTLQPVTGYEIEFTSFTYTGQASGTGPIAFSLRSSIDNYASEIGTATAAGAALSLSAFQNISAPITFRLFAWGASASTGTFSINSFSFEGMVALSSPLPVHFSGLRAIKVKEGIQVQFRNETEENLDQYFFEHSENGVSFRVLKAQAPEHNAGGPASYLMVHEAPAPRNFYRLRALEKDGQVSLSKIIRMDYEGKATLRVYPSPTRERAVLEVEWLQAGVYELAMFNGIGMKVLGTAIRHEGGLLRKNLDFKGIQGGIYWIWIGGRGLQVLIF